MKLVAIQLPDLVRLLPEVEQRSELISLVGVSIRRLVKLIVLCVMQQNETFNSWNQLERVEQDLMQKEEFRQREIEAQNKVIPVYTVGDFVTCQFKRIGGR